MKRALILREPTTDEGTLGFWSIPGTELRWCTIELPARDNLPQQSCIDPMPGERNWTYSVKLDSTSKWSPRPDGMLYEVQQVQGRSEIKIHAGTWAGDVRLHYHSDLLGCIAPGRHFGELQPPDVGFKQKCVLESRGALREIMDYLAGEPFELEIGWKV